MSGDTRAAVIEGGGPTGRGKQDPEERTQGVIKCQMLSWLSLSRPGPLTAALILMSLSPSSILAHLLFLVLTLCSNLGPFPLKHGEGQPLQDTYLLGWVVSGARDGSRNVSLRACQKVVLLGPKLINSESIP